MLADRLKACRDQAGDTQADLAEIVGFNAKSISRWETGEREPTFATLVKLADHYAVTTDWLLGRSDNPQGFSSHASRVPATDAPTDSNIAFKNDARSIEISGQAVGGADATPISRVALVEMIRELIREELAGRGER